jgi:hypothetical protein
MEITGIHRLADPFVGNGTLTISGCTTDNLRKLPIELVVERINALSTEVVASLTGEGRINLVSPNDFTISGYQDVLDVLGIDRIG